MPFGSDHDRWADSTGAYLLDALPDDEREGFEAHLDGCRFCREEIDFLRVASDALPAAVPQMAPPPELRGRIMAVVEREAQLLQAAKPEAPAPATAPRPERVPWWRRLSLAPLKPGLALAGVLLVLVGALGGALLAGDDGPVPVRTIAGQAQTPGTAVRLVVSGQQGRLEADRLPRPPEGRVYQVWIKRVDREQPEPTDALFVPAADGRAATGVPGSLEGVEAVLVTDEPAGGSPAPTGKVTLSAPLERS